MHTTSLTLCQYPKTSNYRVNCKKRDLLFLTITLANLNRFLQSLYYFINSTCDYNKIYHTTRFMCAPYLKKIKTYIFAVVPKR